MNERIRKDSGKNGCDVLFNICTPGNISGNYSYRGMCAQALKPGFTRVFRTVSSGRGCALQGLCSGLFAYQVF